MKKKTKTTKKGRKVVIQKPVKRKASSFMGDGSLSDGGFSDQFGRSKPPVLYNGLDMPAVMLSATGDSAPLMQDFPDPEDPMNPNPYTVLSDFTNDPAQLGGGTVTKDYPAPIVTPGGGPDITADTLVSPTVSTVSAVVGSWPAWVWYLLIVGVVFGIVYISKKK